MKIVFRCPPELEGLIPPPIPAKRGLPDWLKTMSNTPHSHEFGFEIDTVKRCPPFIDAMGKGFLMPLAVDLHVEDGQFSWEWDPPVSTVGDYNRAPIGFHSAEQLVGSPHFAADTFAVKFMTFWTITLPTGWGLLCTHPSNRDDLPFRTLTGFVHADNYENFIHFPALWTDASFSGTLPHGTPVAQCYPVPHEALELVTETLTGDAAERFRATKSNVRETEGTYRRDHRSGS